MTSPSTDYAQQLLAYLQAWRQHLEQTVGAMTPSQYVQPPAWGMSAAPPPPAPFMPPPMPAAAWGSVATPPTDYTQQLLAYLQAWRQYLEQTTGAAAAGPPQPPPATPPPVAPLLQPWPITTPPPNAPPPNDPPPNGPPPNGPPPNDPPPNAWSPRPATSASTPQGLEYVVPAHGWMSHFSFAKEPAHPEGEPVPGSGSLYHSSRSLLPSSQMVEYQPNSSYLSARSVTSTGWVSGAEEPVYSNPATPTARVQEEKAVPERPEQLEIVKPLIEPKK